MEERRISFRLTYRTRIIILPKRGVFVTAVKKFVIILICVAVIVTLFCGNVFADFETGAVYSSNKKGKRAIALTFDDGPHPRYTPEILDILQEHLIKATFFTIGENAALYPDVLKRCQDEGHEIANHTYSHKDLSRDSLDDICREISSAEDVISRCIDYRTRLFRPPGGLFGKNVIAAARELDYTIVLWTVDTRDWDHTPAEVITRRVLEDIDSGDIILMHDFIGKDSPTPEALRKMIPMLLEEGYSFVTVSELLGYS